MQSDEFPVGLIRAVCHPRVRRALGCALRVSLVLALGWLLLQVVLAKTPLFRRRTQSATDGPRVCKSNLHNLWMAANMWAEEHQGRYPARLHQLIPRYLRAIPTCPSAGRDTYSAGYQSNASPPRYTLVCQGHNHGEVGLLPDYPSLGSQSGFTLCYQSTPSHAWVLAGTGAALFLGLGAATVVVLRRRGLRVSPPGTSSDR